jgi:PPM family protein phosphatase
VQPDDVYLLCSDGLTDPLSDEELLQPLATLPPADAAEHLVQAAYEAGGKDNITAVVIKVLAV